MGWEPEDDEDEGDVVGDGDGCISPIERVFVGEYLFLKSAFFCRDSGLAHTVVKCTLSIRS